MTALDNLERDPSIAAVILTGSKRAFAAGADIKDVCKHNNLLYINSEINLFILKKDGKQIFYGYL